MNNKKILELILNSAGLEMKNFELIKYGSKDVGYEFEAYSNDEFEFSVETDNFQDAIADTLREIYQSENIEFTAAYRKFPNWL